MPLSYRVVTAQALVTVVAALLFALFGGLREGTGALLGGLCVALPAALMAWRAARERSPQRLLALGVAKFAATCLLLAAVIVVFKPAPAGLFVTLVACQLAYVLVPAWWPERR